MREDTAPAADTRKFLSMVPPESRWIAAAVRRAIGDADRVVLAVSGGVDSMVLLDAAASSVAADRLVVATFDHGTGDHATRAAERVSERAHDLGVACERGEIRDVASTEAMLRDARWRFLRAVAARHRARVATAHTADDQIETVLMRTMRGAGARGLAALRAESETLRPLLDFDRRDVLRYAEERDIEWVEDPSNESRRYFRNRVRHEILPAMRAVRPSIDRELAQIGVEAADWRRKVDRVVDEAVNVRVLPVARGLDVDAKQLSGFSVNELRVLLPAIVARAGVVLDRRGIVHLAEFARHARVGAHAQFSGNWEVVRSRDALQLRASTETRPTPTLLALSESTSWSAWFFTPRTTVDLANAWQARLRTDRPLQVRAWRPGDVMRSAASGRARKVKNLLSKAGVTGHERGRWPVVLAGDEIVWIPGVRRSDVAPDSAGQPGLSFTCEHVNR